MTSPNQRTIVSDRTEVPKGTGKERPFLIAYRDIIENAAKVLNGNAFKLYIYLLCLSEQRVIFAKRCRGKFWVFRGHSKNIFCNTCK